MFVNIEEAIWLTIITMTTVGYGDIYAVTTFGRAWTVVIALTGTLMVSLLVSTMSDQLKLSFDERKVINDIVEKQDAAKAIQHFMKLNVL